MTDEEQKVARICCGNLHPKHMCDKTIECHYTEVARELIDLIEQARKDTAKEIIEELKGDMAIAKFTFNPTLADELKTIYLRLEREYEVGDE